LEQFSPAWERAFRHVIRWVKDAEHQRGWPEVVMYLSDELSNHGEEGAKKGRKLVDLTQNIKGIRTVCSMNGRWEHVMLPGLKIAMPNHAFPIEATRASCGACTPGACARKAASSGSTAK